jgi:hypothetical protein
MRTLKLFAVVAFVAALTFVAPSAHAQTSLLNSSSRALDTVTNTGTKSMTSAKIAGARASVTISTVNAVLTGTLSGVARLYGSLDGTNYQRIRTFQLHNSQVDSLVVDANHTKYAWVVDGNPFQYYQVQTTGVGTVTFTVAGKSLSQTTK